MDSLYQILTWALSGTTGIGIVSFVAYWKQNRRIKDAEVKEKEVAVEQAKIEARKNEIDLLYSQLERANAAIEQKDKRLSELNEAIDKHIDRRRVLSDRLDKAEQEANHANRELVAAKDEIIRLTEKSDRLEAVKCLWTDCQDPRGPKPPRKDTKTTTSISPKET